MRRDRQPRHCGIKPWRFAFGTVLASLYSGPWVVAALAGGAGLTVALTFLLPVLHRPGHAVPAGPPA